MYLVLYYFVKFNVLVVELQNLMMLLNYMLKLEIHSKWQKTGQVCMVIYWTKYTLCYSVQVLTTSS